MTRLRPIIAAIACLLLTATLHAGQPGKDTAAPLPQQQDGYIRASLLVISPAAEVYSLFGHCALRLDCPSQRMDYCFTFETADDTKGILAFLKGEAKGGVRASRTDRYLQTYHDAGRSVAEYPLCLTPEQKLRLWMTVDEEIARGSTRHYDYLHTHCASVAAELVERAIAPSVLHYGELPPSLQGSYRDVLFAASHHPWSTFFWQTIMGPAADRKAPLRCRLVPVLLPQAWQHATAEGAPCPILCASPTVLVDAPKGRHGASMPSPTLVFGLLLLLAASASAGQHLWGWKQLPAATDILLASLHSLLAVGLLWLVACSRLEATTWNWYLLVFNPLPALAGLATHAWAMAGQCLLAMCLITLLLTPFIPQLDLPHGLLIASIATRLASARMSPYHAKP